MALFREQWMTVYSGLAIVRKRGEGRKAFSSVQTLAVNNPILERYTSDEQKQLAIASYANKKSRK